MSGNADVWPGRTEALVPLLRRELGDSVALFADANGSYDAPHAIEVGRMLEAHGFGFFEEPCPFDRYDETRQVADALTIAVAGGEQDSSLRRWEEMIRTRVVDLPQPDLIYNGGFIRTARVAALAAACGMPVTLHNPHTGPSVAYVLQFVARTANAADPHEYNPAAASEAWFDPPVRPRGGTLQVPTGAGLGVRIDQAALRQAARIAQVRRYARVVRSVFRRSDAHTR